MHILVTGGAGYVGAVLIPKLIQSGYKTTVLDWYIYEKNVFKKYKKNPLLHEIKGDIRNSKLVEKSLKNIDAVIHLACISNDPSFDLDPALGRSINYDATRSLIDSAKKSGVKRFVYASSSSVYGIKNELEVTEDLPLLPLTDYSKYKALCEEYLLKKADKNFVGLVLRPATVCGFSPRLRLDLTVNILTMNALTNRKITVFGGSQKRPNIHIEDMTDLYVKTLSYPDALIDRKIYNAVCDNYSLLEIADMVKKTLADRQIQIEIQPTSDLRSYHVSSQKIKNELGFVPKHSVVNAISDLQAAYRAGKIENPAHRKYFNIKTMNYFGKELLHA